MKRKISSLSPWAVSCFYYLPSLPLIIEDIDFIGLSLPILKAQEAGECGPHRTDNGEGFGVKVLFGAGPAQRTTDRGWILISMRAGATSKEVLEKGQAFPKARTQGAQERSRCWARL